jgi:choline-sulfatase
MGHPDVVLISIDTLRADHATPELMPAVAGLAARGLRFTAARTVAPLTLPAHTSLMTGLYPPRHGVRLNGVRGLTPGVPTLAQAFSSAGYDTAAFIGAFVLDRRFGLSEGFAEYDDRIPRRKGAMDRLEAERRGSDVVDSAVRWLMQPARAQDRPLFVWVHLYDPHAPYEPPDDARRRGNGDPYSGEVAYADAQVGRLIAALSAAGRREPLIVVIGDHGESLGEHGEPGHGLLLYEGAVRIPLVVAGPGVPHGDRSDPVSLVDVAPTLLARADLSRWPNLDGRDLLAAPSPEDREVYAETEYPRAAGWSPLAALANARWKLVDSSQPELYDAMEDRRETSNRAADRPRDVAGMRQRLSVLRSTASPVPAAVPADVERKLRALGYVAAAPTVPLPPNAPNPAAMMPDWSAFESALAATGGKEQPAALVTLQRLAQSHPDSPLFVTTWARALAAAGRHREALIVFRGAASRWPGDSALAHDLALSAQEAGQPAEAMASERRALEIDPSNPLALNGLGLLLADSSRSIEARAAFGRAAAIDSTNPEYLVNLGNAARETGDEAAAERAYKAALALNQEAVDALNGLAVVLVQRGRARDGIPLLERALGLEPEFVDARLNLGIARQEAGDLVGARAAYEEVMRAPARFGRQRATAKALLGALPRAGPR